MIVMFLFGFTLKKTDPSFNIGRTGKEQALQSRDTVYSIVLTCCVECS